MATTIVVPLDTSPVAERALPVAQSLARTLHASITLVSVVELPFEFNAWLLERDGRRSTELEATIRDRKHYLDHHASRLGDTETTAVVRMGNAPAEILALADSLVAPIIVMTSHGITGFRQQVVGTVTTRVIHGARCPVVVFRATPDAAPHVPELTFTRLLVALDGSPCAEQALHTTIALFGAHKPRLHLIRVAEHSHWFTVGYDGVGYYDGLTSYIDAAREEAAAYLRDLAGTLAGAGYEVTWEVREDIADRAIIDAVHEHRPDLLVLGTHGRSGVRRIVIGSVAERVLNNASAPVMLVHPRETTRRSRGTGASTARSAAPNGARSANLTGGD